MRAVLLLLVLSGCAVETAAPCIDATPGPVAYVVAEGWHTEIGLPAEEITGRLAVFRSIFPGARVLMFGFGKRTFITAKVEEFDDLVMGPFPGPGAIQVTGLSATPDRAYASPVSVAALSPEGASRLSDFLWEAIAKDEAGGPRLLSEGLFPGSLFYFASHGYSLDYTCNAWTADALRHAGVAVTSEGVVFAGQVRRALAAAAGVCAMPET